MIEQFASVDCGAYISNARAHTLIPTHTKGHHEIQLIGVLEGEFEGDNEGVVHKCEYSAFC